MKTPNLSPPQLRTPKPKAWRRTAWRICRHTAPTCSAEKRTAKPFRLLTARGRERFGRTQNPASRIPQSPPPPTRSPAPPKNVESPDSPCGIHTTAESWAFTPDDWRRATSSPSDSQTRRPPSPPPEEKKAVLGTNPFSLAVPDGDGGAAILIDQSASVVAKSEVMKHAREKRDLPPGWALDSEGRPTTSPEDALRGTMAPSGGYKGAGIALMTEMMAAALTGANLGIQASPFSGTAGGPPGTGQFFLALDPDAFGDAFGTRVSELLAAFAEQDARIPGAGRKSARQRAMREGAEVNPAVLAKARELAGV